MKENLVALKAGLVISCAVLVSCAAKPPVSDERRVSTSEEVANVFVSAYPAVPWAAIADKLEPKHDLSSADARALAAVTTQSQVNQFLSTFAAGLALGLPTRTHSSAFSVADGKTTTSSTSKVEPGTVPASSGAVPMALTDASLAADLGKAPLALGVDASTQLTAGTAVFQLARILDNQISKSIALQGYQAHLLTFQVNLQPKGRNLPYDAYVNLTLMPASWKKALKTSEGVARDASEMPAVVLYPLVISDAMESSSSARSVEAIRQAALALSGIVSNVGVNAGVSGSSDSLQSLVGSDRNSLVTVGRVSDHTLRMRFGAQLQGSRTLAMVPRTHNVSVVVFTRAGDAAEAHIDRLAVITETAFLDAKDGAEVASSRNTSPGRAKVASDVKASLREYGYRLSDDCNYAPDLLRALDRGDYGYVSHCVADAHDGDKLAKRVAQGNTHPNGLNPAEEARLRRVVADLMTKQVDSRFSKFLVQLTPFKSTALQLPAAEQLALLNDDRSALRVVLREGSNLQASKLKARLIVKPADKPFTLLPSALEADADGKTLSLAFPSLLGNGLMAAKPATATAKAETDLDPELALEVSTVEPMGAPSVRYTVKLQRPERKAPGTPLSTGSAALLVDAAGGAEVTLLVADWDAKKQGELGVRVQGAEVRAAKPARAIDAKLGVVPVAGGSAVTLVLGNVTPARAVQIVALANKQPVGDAITLPVVPAPAAPK